jgi:hypothetical protein
MVAEDGGLSRGEQDAATWLSYLDGVIKRAEGGSARLLAACLLARSISTARALVHWTTGGKRLEELVEHIVPKEAADVFHVLRKFGNAAVHDAKGGHADALPTGASSPFWSNDYEAYLEWRQAKLWNEIKRVTGIQETADLEEATEEEAASDLRITIWSPQCSAAIARRFLQCAPQLG